MDQARRGFDSLAAQLDSLSPLRVLARGYSLTETASDGQVVHDATELYVGQELLTRFGKGRATSRVESIDPEALA
jgi:exodeoxyribonuclease VII large subunit